MCNLLTELGGKAGCFCDAAKSGQLRCPLNIRPTSEDVVTGELFGRLQVLNPRWWLPDFLNTALGTERFRRQIFRGFEIKLWQKQRSYPREHLRWNEGVTEVDVEISWENPPTTVYVEMKYGSAVSKTTAQNNGTNGFPADQLVRNARVGLRETGWFREDVLFAEPRRDFVLILMSPTTGNELVEKYQNPEVLRAGIPNSSRLTELPELPFIGEIGYANLPEILVRQRRWFTRVERMLIDQIVQYIDLKLAQF